MENSDVLTIEKIKEQIKSYNSQADLGAIDKAF